MQRKIYVRNDSISLEEYLDADCPLLFDSWNEEETILAYNYRLPDSYQEYYEHCKTRDTWGAVIKRIQDTAIIGRVGISPGLPDLTITVFKPYRNQGYGTMAFMLAIKYCFEVLNLREIYAGCYEDNRASLNMIKHCGFMPHPAGDLLDKHINTGKNRRQYDFILTNPG